MDESKECIILAKKEYTSILVYYLYLSIYQGIKSIWDSAKVQSKPREVYEDFQNRLKRVRKWNQDIIDHEYKRIVHKTKCEWLTNLIKKIFVVNTQILAAINLSGGTQSRIKVKIPSADKFIHVCYIECAKAFYENALLMEDRASNITKMEQSKNLQKSYKIISNCIENAIRILLPIESLVNEIYDVDGEGEDATPLPRLYESISPYNISNGNIEIRKVPQQLPQLHQLANFQQLPQLNTPVQFEQYPQFDQQPPVQFEQYPQFDQQPPVQFEQQQPHLDYINLDTTGMDKLDDMLKDIEFPMMKESIYNEVDTENSSTNNVQKDTIPMDTESTEKVKSNGIDLDVISISDRTKDVVEDVVKLPAIDNFDSKSFFSDADE